MALKCSGGGEGEQRLLQSVLGRVARAHAIDDAPKEDGHEVHAALEPQRAETRRAFLLARASLHVRHDERRQASVGLREHKNDELRAPFLSAPR